ncbi:hypothetical protein, variant [Aphanomyces astaci]|uniref:CHAT domain-containing protein n=1 Tax=Aphanomyces astaci TaxID=112090 RepID=W4GRT3_APHAT|nr:hypothetical protein, variant [Aphanomyces astaci]ETV81588.1 hypothetical protein, variant [Aphanomyces astaci]|eukprot:XP_009829446.1 hypothetical protein, variant [Aphanomyces astaci]
MNSPDLSDDTLLDVDLSLLLSSEDEAKFHHVVYFLQLHPTLINQLSRQQVNAFRAAGLLEIELSASHRSASITREMLTTGPMALMFPHYKTFFGVNHVTFRWQATTSGVDVTMANTSRRPVFVGLRVLAPQGIMALHLHDLVRLLETPSKVLLLGYVVTKRAIPLSVHPPAHNLLGLLYSQPILQYTRLGLTLNNRDVHNMRTALATGLVNFVQMSELLVNEAGQSVPFVSQSVGWEVECASWKVLEDLVSDGCQMLHLSCATTSKALILEDGRGGAFPVGVDALKRLFQGSAVQLVQLSECPSPTGGTASQLLLDAGVPYVVAAAPHIRQVTSSQLLRFSTHFYGALMGGKSIDASFCFAQNSPKLPADLFCLYGQSNGHHGSEVLFPITDAPETIFESLPTHRMTVNVCKGFIGRLRKAHDICFWLLDPTHDIRFVNIHGPSGIGKTQLALAATQYATDRGAFDGGIRLLHVKDMVQRKGAEHAVVWLQRIFINIKTNRSNDI